jgi:hypothetical protein
MSFRDPSRVGTAAKIAASIALFNFLAYVTATSVLGGDAVNGHIADGHYYLAMHGRTTEVSRAVFEYSLWHTYALWITFAVAIGLWLLERRRQTSGP